MCAALLDVEADRITNSLNMLAEQVVEWEAPARGLSGEIA
jgi:hypothetical protein